MLKDPKILKRLAGIREIPTLPEVMQNVMTALASEDSSAEDLAVILSNDQALCSKVLKVANSAFFAQSRRIYDINDAVVLLGFDSIAQLTLATAIFPAFGTVRSSERFDVNAFWEHSIATAFAGKFILEMIGDSSGYKFLYTAGLLHDIGKMVLITRFPYEYALVLERAATEDLFLYEAEKHVLGFTHCDIGEWVCNRWNFPDRLVRVIARHHADGGFVFPVETETAMIHLADIICNRLRIGHSGNRKTCSLDPEGYSEIGLGPGEIGEIEKYLESSRSEVESLLGIIMSDH